VNLAAVRSNMARTGLMDARLMMTAAMAFFSISITLNVAGIRLNDLRPSNLRHTVVRTYSDTNAHVERYYENMRVVYQLESRVRELRRAAEASDAAIRTTRQPQQRRKSTSGSPGTEQMTPQSMPQSNSRPAPSDGVARRDKAGKKSHTDTEPAPPAASPVTGDVLEASLQFPSVPFSLPQAERCNTGYEQDPRSEA
jgi:ABC-type multidrug transport system fused ATPase/permease subunit